MFKIVISMSMLSVLAISSCAQTPEDVALKHSSPVQSERGEKAEALIAETNTVDTKTADTMTDSSPKDYWVKKPGTLVYNSARDITRSLRLQPKVTVHKQVDGWGLISLEKDEWVKLSDVTLAQPAGVLAGPQESTGRPTITIDDMLKANDQRQKP